MRRLSRYQRHGRAPAVFEESGFDGLPGPRPGPDRPIAPRVQAGPASLVTVNAVLNWALINGTWILPELGLPGIGIMTSLVYLLSFLALHASARRGPALAPLLDLRIWHTRRTTLRRLTALGTPIAAHLRLRGRLLLRPSP